MSLTELQLAATFIRVGNFEFGCRRGGEIRNARLGRESGNHTAPDDAVAKLNQRTAMRKSFTSTNSEVINVGVCNSENKVQLVKLSITC